MKRELSQCCICYLRNPAEELISPCNCKGSVKKVHSSCLKNWVKHCSSGLGMTNCMLCTSEYRSTYQRRTVKQIILKLIKMTQQQSLPLAKEIFQVMVCLFIVQKTFNYLTQENVGHVYLILNSLIAVFVTMLGSNRWVYVLQDKVRRMKEQIVMLFYKKRF